MITANPGFIPSFFRFSTSVLSSAFILAETSFPINSFAIVVVEGVHAKLDQGYKSSREASIDAMSELGGAIVSITLVMMSVFIPVSFMGGTAGTFYRQFVKRYSMYMKITRLNTKFSLQHTPVLPNGGKLQTIISIKH